MNIHPSFTHIRSYVAYEFSVLRARAIRDSIWAKLIGTYMKLARFPEQAPVASPNRKLIGVQEIPVEQIVGTLGRHSDFDQQFRPLKKSLRDRWVNAYLTLESDGWSPILVHKVGDKYYVEDGHHRVSVARSLGLAYIQAKIWDYPSRFKQPENCETVDCTEKSPVSVYAVITE